MKKIFLMRISRLSFLILFLNLVFFVILPPKTFSAVNPTINEFLAHPSSGNKEWVEFYNPDQLDLSSYFLDDDTGFSSDTGSSSKKSLATVNSDNPLFPNFEMSSFLNNGGDHVVLFSPEGEIIDQYQYTDDPGVDTSIGRFPDGSGEFNSLTSSTKGFSNSSPFIPTSTPIPTNTPVPIKTPTSIKTSTIKTTAKAVDATVVKPTSISTNSQIQKTVSNSSKSVLGDKNQPTIRLSGEKETSSPTSNIKNENKIKEAKVLGSNQNNIFKILIGVGGLFIIACAILLFRHFKNKKVNNE